MPDLITHTIVAYLVRNRNIKIHNLIIYLLGAMLPDLATRPFMIIFPPLRHFFHAFHTPIALAIIIIVISYFFEESKQRLVIFLLSLGTLTHLFLDAMQQGVADRGYGWLFPFSYIDFRFGLFWPEDSISVLPFIILIFLADFLISRKNKNKKVH